MKFCKKYDQYMQGMGQKKLPGVGFKNLKKILKKCKEHPSISPKVVLDDDLNPICQVVSGKMFFSILTQESKAVLKIFNERAERLLERHLALGCSKCCILFKENLRGDHFSLVQEGKDLVAYAIINAVAMRKILKKFNKICDPEQGQALKEQVHNIYMKILQSPFLLELIALQMNVKEPETNSGEASRVIQNSLVLNDEKPSLSCELFDSTIKIDIDLTCSICLEILFDPVSLSCGHIFCNICACKAASVTIVEGLKAANSNQSCPICRKVGVYKCAIQLEEVHILISRSFPEYWKERRKSEKAERMQQVKEYWDSHTRLFIGAS